MDFLLYSKNAGTSPIKAGELHVNCLHERPVGLNEYKWRLSESLRYLDHKKRSHYMLPHG